MLIRYSRWDGSQQLDALDADDLLSAMSDDLMTEGDLANALRRLLQRGLPHREGRRQPGLQSLLEQLRQRRQQRLDRYDLGSVLKDIEAKLERVLRTERAGIEGRLAEERERVARGESSRAEQRKLEQRAAKNRAALDALPPDVAGRIGKLQDYDFIDPEARLLFQELLDSLRQQLLKPVVDSMQQALQGLTRQDLARMREMLQDLNRMLRERAAGREPDFKAFQAKWGRHFPGVENLDQLLESLARQMAQMQSLLASLSPDQRRQLQDAMRAALLQDERLEATLAQLATSLAQLLPPDAVPRPYPFRGDDQLGLDEAMRLMEELGRLDRLERQLRGAREPRDLDRISPEEVEKLLGRDAAEDLEQLRAVTKMLEDAGYLERKGDRLELTARAIRKIGDRALRDIFLQLKRDRFGRHAVERRGAGGDRSDEAKPYEFGDPFLLDLNRTLRNAIARRGPGTPVAVRPDDFEVFRTELATQSATVVMLDLSRSMLNNGYFLPAKKVALALSALIRSQFPRDTLHVVGFSLYAQEIAIEALPALTWSDSGVGTNMHAGFLLARGLLARHRGGNKQIIMITDGEPTAHLEHGQPQFWYPPSRRTMQETLREVQRCTREGVTINTFMLEESEALVDFVEQMARLNRGRAFFSAPERLGEYVLVDYVRTKRRSS